MSQEPILSHPCRAPQTAIPRPRPSRPRRLFTTLRTMLKRITHLLRPLLMLLFISSHALALTADQLLEPTEAFRFSARAIDAQTLEARWQIADEYYMYRDKFRFTLEPAGIELGTPVFPSGQMRDDELFGRVETYRHEVRIRLPLQSLPTTDTLTLKVRSQGCADLGVCYPPSKQEARISLAAWRTSSAATAVASSLPMSSPDQGNAATRLLRDTRAASDSSDVSDIAPASRTAAEAGSSAAPVANDESSLIARRLQSDHWFTSLLFFFGAGLALAFTPCMLPMVPILSGLIVGHGHRISKLRATTLSSAYVLGMALSYAAIGVAAGLSGTLLSAALQSSWFMALGAAIFVLLALAMFGLYELQMPSFLQGKLRNQANHQQGGSFHGSFLMGVLSAAIVGPCVAAPLAGALLHIAKTGDALFGGVALFVMGLGMGLPLILAGASARHLLPKPGPWMNAINRLFGVILLGVALWLITPLLPEVIVMLAWAMLFIIPAIYLHALEPLPRRAHGWQRLGKGIGIIALIYGAALLIGALGGSRDPMQPLGFLGANAAVTRSAESAAAPRFGRIATLAELEQRLAASRQPVMLDFYADWCISCKEMERLTFAHAEVARNMQDLLLLQVDVTANTADDQALLKHFGLFGPPGILFFAAGGQELGDLRVIGFKKPDEFLPILQRLR